MNKYLNNTESKPGVITSEFWLLIVVNVLTLVEAFPVPDKYKWLAPLISFVSYTISRGIAKQGQPSFTEEPPYIPTDEEIDASLAEEPEGDLSKFGEKI